MPKHLPILALGVVFAVALSANQARAQSCSDLEKQSWSDLRSHVYLVHALTAARFLADGTIGHHLYLRPIEIQGGPDGGFVRPPFEFRPTLHMAWNHLVQSPGTAGNWEDATMALLEPFANYDRQVWAATPYDTIVLGPHKPGKGAILLVKGAALAESVKKVITENPDLVIETIDDKLTMRQAVAVKLESMPTLWQVHDSPPDEKASPTQYAPKGGIDVSDLAKQKKTIASMPIWITSHECPRGVQLLGDVHDGVATRPASEPAFMTDLWNRKLYFGLHVPTAVQQLDGSQSPGGQAAGLFVRAKTCAEARPGALDVKDWVQVGERYVMGNGLDEQGFPLLEVVPDIEEQTVPCSTWTGATAKAKHTPLDERLVCRALRTKAELTQHGSSPYGLALGVRLVLYAMYIDARVTAPSSGVARKDLGTSLWLAVASRRIDLEKLASDACTSDSKWDAYIAALAATN